MARKDRNKEQHNDDVEFDFDTDVKINPHFLDAECLEHAEKFNRYSKASAIANRKAKLAEEKVKTIRSEIIIDANEDPDKVLGKGIKPNAQIVEAHYRTDPDYKKAKREMIDAQFEAEMRQNGVFTFQSRKLMLELLVQLANAGYFSAPDLHNLADAAEELRDIKRKQTQQLIRDRLNKEKD